MLKPLRRRLNLLLCLLTLSLLSSPVFSKDRALLIGINKYTGVQPLRGTHNDVEMVKLLLNRSFGVAENSILVLHDDKATRENILNKFRRWLVDETKPGDRVFFYYSGHGAFIKDQPGGDEVDGYDETLVAQDAYRDASGVFQNMIRDDEIEAMLKELEGRHVMVMFDSCHSGTMTRGALVDQYAKVPYATTSANSFTSRSINDDPVIKQHQKESGFVKSGNNSLSFFAVAPNQLAREYVSTDGNVYGLYTTSFVRAIYNKAGDFNKDGTVTLAELQEYVRKSSSDFCERIGDQKCGTGLTPQVETDLTMSVDILNFGKDITVASAEPSEAVDDVLVHGNDAGLEISVLDGKRIPLGGEIVVKIRSQKSGALLLFDINANETVTQLFPNEEGDLKNVKIRANTDIYVPGDYYGFQLIAEKPLGKNHLVAVLIEDDIDIRHIVSSSKGFGVVDKPASMLDTLRARLNTVFHENNGSNREIRWSMVSASYDIVE